MRTLLSRLSDLHDQLASQRTLVCLLGAALVEVVRRRASCDGARPVLAMRVVPYPASAHVSAMSLTICERIGGLDALHRGLQARVLRTAHRLIITSLVDGPAQTPCAL